ncbi:MAG: Gfo/Idh/MocA family oxidoreductase [Bacteroidales bacterium]|nr:Gfo/Idh/MocA family oxidoreductase [Bacteroidales bacterium]
MSQTKNINRRNFFRKAAGATGAAFALPYIIPSSALGKNGAIAANDRVVMGVIGSGSMGTGDMRTFMGKNEVQMVAACDVDKKHRDRAKAFMDAHYDNTDAKTYGDYREFLANEKLDAVILALPDQWHGIIGVAAANAGLDIYGQKPLARTIWEGRQIVDAVKKNKVIWQTGSWQRSVGNFHLGANLVANGRIGKITRVEVGLPDGNPRPGTYNVKPIPEELDWDMWLGPAPAAPYRGVSHWDWRWILDYSGGQLTDWAGHHIDIAHWALGFDKTGPVEIEGKGVYPRDGIFDVPVEYHNTARYENGLEMTIANARKLPFGMGTAWYGDKGWIHVRRGGIQASDPKILKEKIGADENPLYFSRDHAQNLLDCIRTREETITPAEAAHRSISVGLLCEIAMLTGRKLTWDPVKEEFPNDPLANRMLRRPFRSPWTLKNN